MLRWKSSLKPAAAAPGGGTNPGTSNLVAWLGMEEASGNSVADSTSNNNDFTKTNGSWVTGKVGSYAVRLDGNGDYMDSDANFAVGANVCTVSFWMYWTDTGSDEKFIYELGSRWWQNDGSIAFSWVQNESVFKVSMHDGSGNLEVKFPEPSSGQWVYVTVVHNGPGGSSNAGEIKLYYDGTAQSYSSYSSTKDQASNIGQAGSLFFIGANSTGAQEITIDVDTFAVFSDELTQDEITWMYNSGNGRSYSDVSGATNYRSTIIADNPVAYYRLGEASGATATDEMGSSNGTYGSDTTYGVTGALDGDSNTSVSFAGSSTTNAAVQVSSLTSANFSSGITIELWLKWDSSTGTGMPVEVREGNDGNDRIFFDARSSGTPHWDMNIGGTWYSATGAGVQDGWHLYAFTHDGTNAKTYRDGVLQNTTSASATTFNPDSMGIGQDGNGSNVIVGGVDEVAVYNSALSATELLAHYTAGAGAYRGTVLADNPLFYYRLGESSGATTAYDEVAQASNGTYYGTPTFGETGAVSGDSNTCVLFKGQTDADELYAVNLPTQSSLLPATIELFFKETSGTNSNAGFLFYRATSDASGINKYSSQNRLGYHWGGTHWQFNSGPTYSLDTWYYTALVVTSTAATLYLIAEDGTLTSATNTDTHAALDCDTGYWRIARDQLGSNRFFKGRIDEVALYDQALSQSTIVAHAAAAGFSS